MYKNILVAVDNSTYSDWAFDLAFAMAKKFGSHISCCHVYAARMHTVRFKQMEKWLPPRYRGEKELARQRAFHADLISQGLQMISHTYMEGFQKRCKAGRIEFSKLTMEGKNFLELADEINRGDYDLAIMGALGLGATNCSTVGSVCERVARRARKDLLIVKNGDGLGRRIMVGIDGSPGSMGALEAASALSAAFEGEIEAASAYDPFFHYMAFNSLKKVLSEKAGIGFNFNDQERLHQEIIDKGLENIYGEHLKRAKALTAKAKLNIEATLLAGKPFEQMINRAKDRGVSLIAVGRYGMHKCEGLDIGSNTENIMRLAPCNVLITCRGPQVAPRAEPSDDLFS